MSASLSRVVTCSCLAWLAMAVPLSAAELPEWVWHSPSREAGQTGVLKHRFRISALPRRASMRLATDFSRCEVALNGSPLLQRETHRSPMPAGLLNSLTAAEILDLLAYIASNSE